MDFRSRLGRAGEDLAAALYRRMGFAILDRNYRCPEGELDVVAAKDDLLVFCEVKTRRSDRWGLPCEAVHPCKQQGMRGLASSWLRGHGDRAWRVRFDVVSVVVRDGRARASHIPDAF